METEINLIRGTDDIFTIHGSEAWECEIQGLSGGYPVMWVQGINRGEAKTSNFVFRGAYFFDGPTQWAGANFRVSSHEECISLLDRLGWLSNIPGDQRESYASGFYLITVESLPYKVRILTRAVYHSQEIPAEFKGAK